MSIYLAGDSRSSPTQTLFFDIEGTIGYLPPGKSRRVECMYPSRRASRRSGSESTKEGAYRTAGEPWHAVELYQCLHVQVVGLLNVLRDAVDSKILAASSLVFQGCMYALPRTTTYFSDQRQSL